MKPKFNINDAVQTGKTTGTVREVAKFADHFEYLVAYTNGTAAWYHEDKISAAAKTSTK